MSLAVALDDEPPVDDQVDAPDAGKLDLNVDMAPQRPEEQAHERLCPRFAARVKQVPQYSIAPRQTAEDFGDFRLVHEPGVPGAVQGGHRITRRLTPTRLNECADQVDRQSCSLAFGVAPMGDDLLGPHG
ncbi:hypothetical protein J2Y46_001880 [Microbacterium sp. BE35]|uniref:hypothetical protein n=1 Tax=Microbacterium sp. BE35 TaxID=2817773 RepID=UPI00285A4639|nr:hypothetical protein [Microbacterium sp. BE35]MDR7189057.1 hypothetical protein [Microbacterium sp. BE35]